MRVQPIRKILIDAYNSACSRYDEFDRPFMSRAYWHHELKARSDETIVRFGMRLQDPGIDPMTVVKDRLTTENKRSDWLSSDRNGLLSFNTFFLDELNKLSSRLYRQVIADNMQISLFPVSRSSLHESEVVLWRSDTRQPDEVFRVGFRPWTGCDLKKVSAKAERAKGFFRHVPAYGDSIVTYGTGVSTSLNESTARRYEGWLYAIKFQPGQIWSPELCPVDIHKTWQCMGKSQSEMGSDTANKAEINFIHDGIPATCIEFAVDQSTGEIKSNSTYTGMMPEFIDRRAPLVKADSGGVSETKLDESFVEPVDAAGTGLSASTAAVPPAAVLATRTATSVGLTKYCFSVGIYRGLKGRYHMIFDSSDAANRFIVAEKLMSERNSAQYKRPDPARYRGLFTVRLTDRDYQRLQHSSCPELPNTSMLSAAPVFKS